MDDNLLDRPIVAGSTLKVGALITLQDIQKTLPATGNPWVDVARDLGMIASFLADPAVAGSYLNGIRESIRGFAFMLALRRLEYGLDHLGRSADYPALDRRLARETVAAINRAKLPAPCLAA